MTGPANVNLVANVLVKLDTAAAEVPSLTSSLVGELARFIAVLHATRHDLWAARGLTTPIQTQKENTEPAIRSMQARKDDHRVISRDDTNRPLSRIARRTA